MNSLRLPLVYSIIALPPQFNSIHHFMFDNHNWQRPSDDGMCYYTKVFDVSVSATPSHYSPRDSDLVPTAMMPRERIHTHDPRKTHQEWEMRSPCRLILACGIAIAILRAELNALLINYFIRWWNCGRVCVGSGDQVILHSQCIVWNKTTTFFDEKFELKIIFMRRRTQHSVKHEPEHGFN